MKITVIGTINKDLILPFNDVPIESFGGIFYDIGILSQIAQDVEITPVSYVGEDVISTVQAILDKPSNVNTDGLVRGPETHHKVILEYTSPAQRSEKALFPFPPLEWAHIEPYTDADFIVLNMITGWDIELPTFQKLCEKCGDRIYMDFHFLASDVDEIGKRFRRIPENLQTWLSGPRFIQMNEDEFATLNQHNESEKEFFHRYFRDDQVLILTKASNGVSLVYRKNNITGKKDFPGNKIPRLIDSTGCGDAFGAGFIMNYLENNDMFQAATYGNIVAAAKATLRGTNELYRLKEKISDIKALNRIK